MWANPKRVFQYIRLSQQEYSEEIIDITSKAQVYFSGAACLLYFCYTLAVILVEYFACQSWMPQNLYGFLICGLSAINWLVFKKGIVGKKQPLLISNVFLFVLLLLLGIARGLGGIYVSYGLAVCTAMATAVLSLDPFCYSLIALLAALCECILYLAYTGFDLSVILYGTGLFTTLDALLLFVVSACLNLFVSVLRYRVLGETSTLKKESAIDGLTGLYNRRYFEQYFQFHHRDDELAAMIHIDLDNFKMLNDTLGHQQGDALLVRVSELLRVHFRKTDCVARVGGDEFMVFMPGLSETRHAVDRVQWLLEKFPILVQEQGEEIPISISLGVVFSEAGQCPSYQQLYTQSDDAMYQAKKAGKCRAVIADRGGVKRMICNERSIG